MKWKPFRTEHYEGGWSPKGNYIIWRMPIDRIDVEHVEALGAASRRLATGEWELEYNPEEQ